MSDEGRLAFVQTFLPYADFARSAACLDARRLGKQRVEAYQILRALQGITRGWRNHPATRMWRGYEPALSAYMNVMIDEWTRRGFNNGMAHAVVPVAIEMPPWLGDERLHASHRANLLRKEPGWYAQFGWRDDPEQPYVWPA